MEIIFLFLHFSSSFFSEWFSLHQLAWRIYPIERISYIFFLPLVIFTIFSLIAPCYILICSCSALTNIPTTRWNAYWTLQWYLLEFKSESVLILKNTETLRLDTRLCFSVELSRGWFDVSCDVSLYCAKPRFVRWGDRWKYMLSFFHVSM